MRAKKIARLENQARDPETSAEVLNRIAEEYLRQKPRWLGEYGSLAYLLANNVSTPHSALVKILRYRIDLVPNRHGHSFTTQYFGREESFIRPFAKVHGISYEVGRLLLAADPSWLATGMVEARLRGDWPEEEFHQLLERAATSEVQGHRLLAATFLRGMTTHDHLVEHLVRDPDRYVRGVAALSSRLSAQTCIELAHTLDENDAEVISYNPQSPVEALEALVEHGWLVNRNIRYNLIRHRACTSAIKHKVEAYESASCEQDLDSEAERVFWRTFRKLNPPSLEELRPQVQVGKYRIDFALPSRKIGIEIDGHAHHSKPDAFIKDRERERDLSLSGWRLVRFAAAEVFADPEQCIKQVEMLVKSFAKN